MFSMSMSIMSQGWRERYATDLGQRRLVTMCICPLMLDSNRGQRKMEAASRWLVASAILIHQLRRWQ